MICNIRKPRSFVSSVNLVSSWRGGKNVKSSAFLEKVWGLPFICGGGN